MNLTRKEPELVTGDAEDELDDNDDYSDDSLGDDFGLDDGYGAETMPALEKHNDLLRKLTNFNPYLKDAVNGWLGLVWNEEQKKHIRNALIRPVMNVRGANWCVGFLKTYTRENNVITNISQRDYEQIMSDVIKIVWLNIGGRSEEFSIKNNGDILRVCNELEHAAALVLMGAGDGKYNDMLSTVTTRHENISPQNNYGQMQQVPMMMMPRKHGVVGKVKRFFLGG